MPFDAAFFAPPRDCKFTPLEANDLRVLKAALASMEQSKAWCRGYRDVGPDDELQHCAIGWLAHHSHEACPHPGGVSYGIAKRRLYPALPRFRIPGVLVSEVWGDEVGSVMFYNDTRLTARPIKRLFRRAIRRLEKQARDRD